MEWYEKLSNYFPQNEMKKKSHMQALLEHKDEYRKIETEDYLLLYAEFPDFIFIDYLLVMESARGKGIGSKVLNDLKQKNKLIILEAEPIDPSDEETMKRIQFYQKNGFKLAHSIDFKREGEDGSDFHLKIVYWSPQTLTEKEILRRMEYAVHEIHNFQGTIHYGCEPVNLESLKYNPEQKQK